MYVLCMYINMSLAATSNQQPATSATSVQRPVPCPVVRARPWNRPIARPAVLQQGRKLQRQKVSRRQHACNLHTRPPDRSSRSGSPLVSNPARLHLLPLALVPPASSGPAPSSILHSHSHSIPAPPPTIALLPPALPVRVTAKLHSPALCARKLSRGSRQHPSLLVSPTSKSSPTPPHLFSSKCPSRPTTPMRLPPSTVKS